MTRLAFAAALGLLCCAAGAYFYLLAGEPPSPAAARDLPVPRVMAEREAERHRAEHFVRLELVAQVVALPGSFARREAMYAIAGRADSAAVQALIFDANRVADSYVREELLGVLFTRLTDLDPASALTLSKSRTFAAGRELERTVWRSWSRRDRDAAIRAAVALPTHTERDFAAQALYAAWGYYDNPVVEQIARDIGVQPSRANVTAYLYRLADVSAADAASLVEAITDPAERLALVQSLAAYLTAIDPRRAAGFASHFSEGPVKIGFERAVARERARIEPAEVLQALMNGSRERRDEAAVHAAMQELARRDLDAAVTLLDRIRAHRDREMLISIVAARMAAVDPARAFDWARGFQASDDLHPMNSVLSAIAGSDADLALELAGTLENHDLRRAALTHIMAALSTDDPARAVRIGLELRQNYATNGTLPYAFSSWLKRDSRAAIAWLQTIDDGDQIAVLRDSGSQLISEDIDTAIALLPHFEERAAKRMRREIVRQLAVSGSIERAQSIIGQTDDSPEGNTLRVALAAGLAQRDVYQALQVVEQIPAGPGRDAAYGQLIVVHARANPLEATGWLNSIDQIRLRAEAAGELVAAWHDQDATAAERWALSQGQSIVRDHAIAALAMHWRQPSAEQFELVDGIGNAELRLRVQVQQIYALGSRDIDLARRRLDELDLPDMYVQTARSYLDRLASGL